MESLNCLFQMDSFCVVFLVVNLGLAEEYEVFQLVYLAYVI